MPVTTKHRLNHIEETRLDVYIGEFKLVQAECIDYLGMKIADNIINYHGMPKLIASAKSLFL